MKAKCPECRGELEDSTEPIEQEYRGVELTVNVPVLRCVQCTEVKTKPGHDAEVRRLTLAAYAARPK